MGFKNLIDKYNKVQAHLKKEAKAYAAEDKALVRLEKKRAKARAALEKIEEQIDKLKSAECQREDDYDKLCEDKHTAIVSCKEVKALVGRLIKNATEGGHSEPFLPTLKNRNPDLLEDIQISIYDTVQERVSGAWVEFGDSDNEIIIKL